MFYQTQRRLSQFHKGLTSAGCQELKFLSLCDIIIFVAFLCFCASVFSLSPNWISLIICIHNRKCLLQPSVPPMPGVTMLA